MIVRAGVFYDGTIEPPKTHVDIVLDKGKVGEIRAASGQCDLEAACVTPGLVNAHAHREGSGEPDMIGMIQTTTPNQRLLRAVENARKSVKAGITTIRDVGSSNKIAADVRDAIEEGRIPGPRMRAAPGALMTAELAHAVILPVAYATTRRRILKSWDRFLLPLPFGRGVFIAGEAIEAPGRLDEAGREALRLRLEAALNAVTAEADRLTGHVPIEPAPARRAMTAA